MTHYAKHLAQYGNFAEEIWLRYMDVLDGIVFKDDHRDRLILVRIVFRSDHEMALGIREVEYAAQPNAPVFRLIVVDWIAKALAGRT